MRHAMQMRLAENVGIVQDRFTEPFRRVGRVVIVLTALLVVAYAFVRGNRVLAELQHVSLAEYRRALDLVSVGDALLCFVGFRLALELIRAVAGMRRRV